MLSARAGGSAVLGFPVGLPVSGRGLVQFNGRPAELHAPFEASQPLVRINI